MPAESDPCSLNPVGEFETRFFVCFVLHCIVCFTMADSGTRGGSSLAEPGVAAPSDVLASYSLRPGEH